MERSRPPRKYALGSTTDVRNAGLFLQDEISFGDGRFKLTPSVRYDYYKLSPKPDAEFANANVANSVQPFKLVAALAWDTAGGQYGGQLIGTFVSAKKRVNEDLTQTGPTAPVPLSTSGYATVDMTGYLRLGKQTTLNLAVFNLFDRKYYEWSRVSGLTGNDPRLAAYTSPGRTVSANLRVEF